MQSPGESVTNLLRCGQGSGKERRLHWRTFERKARHGNKKYQKMFVQPRLTQ